MNREKIENLIAQCAGPALVIMLLVMAFMSGVRVEKRKSKPKDEYGQFEKGAAWAFAQVADTNVYLFRDPMELNYGAGVSNITCFFYPKFEFSMMSLSGGDGTNAGHTKIEGCSFSSFGPINSAIRIPNSKNVRSK